ncbi:hypothetical protein OE88DRAFT_1689153, partial [Heliocybe sulcata]
MASVNGIICASKLTLRHWRDVHSRHFVSIVSVCRNRVSPCLTSAYNTAARKRRASTAKALVSQGKHRIPKHDILATARIRGSSALPLRTLKPARLDAEDFVDLTGRVSQNVYFSAAPEEPKLQIFYIYSNVHTPFPPDCQGFFYWHPDTHAPPVSGQVRFRTTTSSDPATFPSGRDLQLPDGRTWNISLLCIARQTMYSGLRIHLLSEKLVTAKVLDTALNMSASCQGKYHISKSNIPVTAVTRPRKGVALLLRTLNQTRLDAQDYVDLTGQQKKAVRFPLAFEASMLQVYYGRPDARRNLSFPTDSKGFFYWHLEPDGPPGSGQVRFRTTASSDPGTFSSGHDLQQPDGSTWNIPLFRIARQMKYSGLRAHLLSEKLVTEMVLDANLNMSASYRDKHSFPKSGVPATTATGLRKGTALLLRTLNQTRLNAEDFADLTGRSSRYVRFPLAPTERGVDMRYFQSGCKRIPFPPDSHGFLYW